MASVLVTGASRGLGAEFARQYAEDGWKVIATCRDPDSATRLNTLAGDVRIERMDVSDFASVDLAAERLAGTAVDILINNAGIGGPRQDAMDMDEEGFLEVFRTNTVAPLKVSQAFHEHVASSVQKKIAVISSGLGSISGNGGGRYAYRSSKAAVNMIMKGLAADWKVDGISVVILAPGWVRTDMGGPGATFSAEESVAGMRKVLEDLTLARSGGFITHQGRETPW